MPFDSVTTYAVIDEMNEKLTGAKINRIYMPTRYEVVLHTFSDEKRMLLINAGSSTPRVHFIQEYNSSMNEPYGFCMLLRKYLSGAVITSVEGHEFDRIIQIHFESINMLGEYRNITLIAEVMGRNSNLILVDDESGLIIDSIKHIRPDNPLYREVIPKTTYEYPTNERLNPLDFNSVVALQMLSDSREETLKKAMMNTFSAISPIIFREIIKEQNIHEDAALYDLSRRELTEVIESTRKFFGTVRDRRVYEIIRKKGKNRDYVCMDFEVYRNLEKVSFDSPSEMIDVFYREQDRLGRLKTVYRDVYTLINRSINRERHKLEMREQDLEKAQGSEKFNIRGQLLLSNLHMIRKGDTSVTVQNFFDDMKEITINLDPALKPAENANRYFKRYAKLENSKKYLTRLIEESRENLYFLQSQALYLERARTYPEVEEIRRVLEELGYIRKKRKKKGIQRPKRLKFVSEDGYEIYVGRNSLDNDNLTRKFASRDDLWIHTKDIPSSHVIIRTEKGRYSKEALELACRLCVYYSPAKNSSNVPVDYTYIRYVKKPAGMKEGKVIYTDFETVQVTLSEEDMKYIESKSY